MSLIIAEDLINRLQRAIEHGLPGRYNNHPISVEAVIRAIQSAKKVQPQKRGRWVDFDHDGYHDYACSNCEKISRQTTEFCPRCGAHMKGKLEA